MSMLALGFQLPWGTSVNPAQQRRLYLTTKFWTAFCSMCAVRGCWSHWLISLKFTSVHLDSLFGLIFVSCMWSLLGWQKTQKLHLCLCVYLRNQCHKTTFFSVSCFLNLCVMNLLQSDPVADWVWRRKQFARPVKLLSPGVTSRLSQQWKMMHGELITTNGLVTCKISLLVWSSISWPTFSSWRDASPNKKEHPF